MENASKALIMAGAILITMAVISLSIFVFVNWKGKLTDTSKMDEQKVSAINSKILPYVGDNISGTQVNAMIQKVYALNKSGETIIIQINSLGNDLFSATGEWNAGVPKKVITGQNYRVEALYNNGYISEVIITH